MGDHAPRPWWPKSPGDVAALVRRLRETNAEEFFTFLVIAAAGGEWDIFKKALEESCELRPSEVRNLLGNISANAEWSLAYSILPLPPALFAYFIKVIEIGWAITRESPEVHASRRLRALVLKKAQLASGASRVLSEELKAELLR